MVGIYFQKTRTLSKWLQLQQSANRIKNTIEKSLVFFKFWIAETGYFPNENINIRTLWGKLNLSSELCWNPDLFSWFPNPFFRHFWYKSWIWALSCAEILIFSADSPIPFFGTFGTNVIFLDFLSFVTKSAKAMQYTFTLKKPNCFSHLRFWRHFEKKKSILISL